MGYTPDIPDGNTPLHNWARYVHEKAQSERKTSLSSKGFYGIQTQQGFIARPRASEASGDPFEFPPGIGLRELSVCVRNEDGSTEEKFIKVYGTVLYSKNSQGQMVDDDGNPLDEYANPTT